MSPIVNQRMKPMVNKQRRLLIRCDHEGPGGSYSSHTFEAVAAPTVDATRGPPATVEPCEPSTGASPALLHHYWSYFPASVFSLPISAPLSQTNAASSYVLS